MIARPWAWTLPAASLGAHPCTAATTDKVEAAWLVGFTRATGAARTRNDVTDLGA